MCQNAKIRIAAVLCIPLGLFVWMAIELTISSPSEMTISQCGESLVMYCFGALCVYLLQLLWMFFHPSSTPTTSESLSSVALRRRRQTIIPDTCPHISCGVLLVVCSLGYSIFGWVILALALDTCNQRWSTWMVLSLVCMLLLVSCPCIVVFNVLRGECRDVCNLLSRTDLENDSDEGHHYEPVPEQMFWFILEDGLLTFVVLRHPNNQPPQQQPHVVADSNRRPTAFSLSAADTR